MNSSSNQILDNAVDALSRFPGIGRKTALRLALYLIKRPASEVSFLTDSISNLKLNLNFCKKCHNICQTDICNICTSPNRNQQLICVVEDFKDIISIELTGKYNGFYHVLNGLISPLDGIGPDDLNIASLIQKGQSGEINEVILALNATVEGDTTMFYLSKKLKETVHIISSISRGISIGSEIDYIDELTLGSSIQNRVPYTT